MRTFTIKWHPALFKIVVFLWLLNAVTVLFQTFYTKSEKFGLKLLHFNWQLLCSLVLSFILFNPFSICLMKCQDQSFWIHVKTSTFNFKITHFNPSQAFHSVQSQRFYVTVKWQEHVKSRCWRDRTLNKNPSSTKKIKMISFAFEYFGKL